MTSRLRRWRDRNEIQSKTIATLCGFSVDDLARIETGASDLAPEDKIALRVLFNDEFSVGQICGTWEAHDEEALLARMDQAFRTKMLAWTR